MTDKVMAFRNESPTRKTGAVRILIIRGRTPTEYGISHKEALSLHTDLSNILTDFERERQE